MAAVSPEMRKRIEVAVKETLEKMMAQPGSTPTPGIPSREVGAVEITSKALTEKGWAGVEEVAASNARIRSYIR